ncbi:acety-l/propionyl-CoA carboxylase subunit alpha [Streptomyces sp. WAC 06738]|uniref:ATP-binding protein n=1 Tax=Streptomyces sp. WAC 06738 TaxID=2203210 RepID=UPI000F702202|nr:biotin carboxylase N-terminal domain-containing protein [Streptomyces sp. WAC 06738]AZM46755.1 acety-l/propionyl-CoA carboxylase subunit alpha [Streptomyces sp. WAC 06738]
MIRTLLVANRGEIACRVFRTCAELGITPVAVHSDADAGALHVRAALDAGGPAVRLPGRAASDTYLRADLLVAAALAAGADAVHPGYGFLSESAEFARAVSAAGLTWVGPPPEAIEAMASKTRAKELMGLAPFDPSKAVESDLPLLVKAAAGGGGRGMRVVRELAALDAGLASASAEAAAAFGDGEVFVEPYVEGGRHVEVQVLADAHGAVWALGTRDCSLQRRHQKVVEEAPAPGLAAGVAAELAETAVRAARAIGYVGAGTVEFLLAPDGRAQFLEMNTRLQVEHPVTEAVYGVDLVAAQVRIAEGAHLPPSAPQPRGHAVEARLYAENPASDFAPQTGRVHRLEVGGTAGGEPFRTAGDDGMPYAAGELGRSPNGAPGEAPGAPAGDDRALYTAGGPGRSPEGVRGGAPVPGRGGIGEPPTLRLDTGYTAGDTVTPYYDALLAKVIVHAPTRAEAIRHLTAALRRARIHGPVTNRDLLVRSLEHEEFTGARMTTSFYDAHLPALTRPADEAAEPGAHLRLAALAAALADAAARQQAGDAALPARFGGWRNVPSQPQAKGYRAEPGGAEVEVRYRLTRDGIRADGLPGVRVLAAAPGRVVLEVAGVARAFDVAVYDGPAGGRPAPATYVDTPHGSYALRPLSRFPAPRADTPPGSLLAPMPGTVVRLADGIAPGQAVRQGQPLLWLEAMKMEHKVAAPASGVLTALHAVPGGQVEVGALLAVVEAAEDAAAHAAPPRDQEGRQP